ncbi:MAG: DUF1800 domain-containing protein [Candidatus Hydrogenedentes bacterium]|nr:DUF1800 domain-containing protein [Candidatus Hydrogenedentota bacterium]
MATDPLQPIDSWNAITARHLLNRAGFGGPSERLASLAKQSPEEAVAFFVDYNNQPDKLPPANFVVPPRDPQELKAIMAALTPEERQKKNSEYQRAEREAIQELKAWWLERMHKSDRPLEEKLTLFWHGHFATSAQKVRSSHQTHAMNAVLRKHAAGNVKQLTIDVGQSPSMLRYLDNAKSTKKQPNENWARELMELFTLGQGQYSETDIKESARAFTGWTSDYQKFVYRYEYHDTGEKVFMGRRGALDGWDIIDVIFEQPAAATFIAGKLWSFFAYDDPEPEIVAALANTLRASDYELRPMLRQMFLSRAFYSEKAIARQVKSPTQFAVQLAFDMRYDDAPYAAMARATQSIGQDLFYPPNVKGWDGNLAWVNANAMLIRYNLPQSLLVANAANDKKKARPAMTPEGDPKMTDGEAMSEPAMQGEMKPAPAAAEPEAWNAQEFFLSLGFTTPNECVSKLAEHFLSVPLSAEQRQVLLAALAPVAGPDARMTRKNVNPRNLIAATHLLLSTAEYQLC